LSRERHGSRERRPRSRLRARAAAALAAGSLAALAPAGCTRGVERATRPNVVVYLVDTLRKDHLSVYGYARETSPRLAEFARDAVRFETTYSPTSWTRPAVASLLSGVTPQRHGAVSRPDRVAPELRLLPEHLGALGYHSRAFVANPNVLPVWGFGRGFDEFHDVAGADGAARADEVNAAVFGSLRRSPREPFFLYVHTVDPHAPYEPPERFRASFPQPSAQELQSTDPAVAARARLADTIGSYDAEVRFNDECFGALVDFLRAEGLYDDALVIFTSDHGEEFRDHGELGHGLNLFQEVVQVPLVVKLPGGAHAGRVVRTPASLLDVLPTILAAAGGPPAPGSEGVDLLDLLRAEEAGRVAGRPFFLDLDLAGVTVERNVVSGVVWGGYKLLALSEPRAGLLLFDLLADPGERETLLPRRRALAASLRHRLAEHRAASEVGVHLWLVNANDEGSRRVEGVLLAGGRFSGLRALQLEAGDEAGLSADSRRLSFRLELRNVPNPIAEPPWRLVDHDRLVFSAEPPGAAIRIESLAIDGAPAPLFLGADARSASAPLALDPTAPELAVAHMTTLFPPTQEASSVAPLGAYLGVVQRSSAPIVSLDPAVEERLQALGYAN
jgi:arylsulfatase A-like enzyme